MGLVEDRAAGRLVRPAALDAHQAVLHQVHLADGVLAAEALSLAISSSPGSFLPSTATGTPASKSTVDVLRPCPGPWRPARDITHRSSLRLVGRVFQVGALVADVPEVAVARVDLLLASARSGMPCALAYSTAASRLVSSKRGSFHGAMILRSGRQGHVGQLEADLVVALAGGAVGDGVGLVPAGAVDLGLGDQRPGDGRAQQVLALVDRAGLVSMPKQYCSANSAAGRPRRTCRPRWPGPSSRCRPVRRRPGPGRRRRRRPRSRTSPSATAG